MAEQSPAVARLREWIEERFEDDGRVLSQGLGLLSELEAEHSSQREVELRLFTEAEFNVLHSAALRVVEETESYQASARAGEVRGMVASRADMFDAIADLTKLVKPDTAMASEKGRCPECDHEGHLNTPCRNLDCPLKSEP